MFNDKSLNIVSTNVFLHFLLSKKIVLAGSFQLGIIKVNLSNHTKKTQELKNRQQFICFTDQMIFEKKSD